MFTLNQFGNAMIDLRSKWTAFWSLFRDRQNGKAFCRLRILGEQDHAWTIEDCW
jgi:hypothetical protein